jgi:hypothetical protein
METVSGLERPVHSCIARARAARGVDDVASQGTPRSHPLEWAVVPSERAIGRGRERAARSSRLPLGRPALWRSPSRCAGQRRVALSGVRTVSTARRTLAASTSFGVSTTAAPARSHAAAFSTFDLPPSITLHDRRNRCEGSRAARCGARKWVPNERRDQRTGEADHSAKDASGLTTPLACEPPRGRAACDKRDGGTDGRGARSENVAARVRDTHEVRWARSARATSELWGRARKGLVKANGVAIGGAGTDTPREVRIFWATGKHPLASRDGACRGSAVQRGRRPRGAR